MVLDDALDRVDRLETHLRIGRAALERAVKRAGKLGVGGNRHVVLRRVCRGGSGRQLHGPDVGVELADRAAGEIFEVASLAIPGLVGSDIGIPADIDQLAGRVVDRHRQVTADAVGIVDVEDGRPGLLAAVDAADRLDPGVVDRKAVPANVGRRLDVPGNADRVLVALQELPDVLRLDVRLVGIEGAFPRGAGEERIVGQTLGVDPDRRKADIGVRDRRPRDLIALLEANVELVGTARRPGSEIFRLRQRRFVVGLRCRRVDIRLTADSDEILIQAPGSARQDHAHPGVTGIGREVIVAVEGVLLERKGPIVATGGVAERCQREVAVGIIGDQT